MPKHEDATITDESAEAVLSALLVAASRIAPRLIGGESTSRQLLDILSAAAENPFARGCGLLAADATLRAAVAAVTREELDPELAEAAANSGIFERKMATLGQPTPGPWQAETTGHESLNNVVEMLQTRDGCPLAEFDFVDVDNAANARLAAASPNLFKAMEAVLEHTSALPLMPIPSPLADAIGRVMLRLKGDPSGSDWPAEWNESWAAYQARCVIGDAPPE